MKTSKCNLLFLITVILLSYPSIVMGVNDDRSYQVKEGDSRIYQVNRCFSSGVFTPKLLLSFIDYFGSKYQSAMNISQELLFEVSISEIPDQYFYRPYKKNLAKFH